MPAPNINKSELFNSGSAWMQLTCGIELWYEYRDNGTGKRVPFLVIRDDGDCVFWTFCPPEDVPSDEIPSLRDVYAQDKQRIENADSIDDLPVPFRQAIKNSTTTDY